MRRRQFITLLGGAAAWPIAARAQQTERMRHIGVFVTAAADNAEYQARVVAFQQALEQLGWTIGRNVRIDIRFFDTDQTWRQLLEKRNDITTLQLPTDHYLAGSIDAVYLKH